MFRIMRLGNYWASYTKSLIKMKKQSLLLRKHMRRTLTIWIVFSPWVLVLLMSYQKKMLLTTCTSGLRLTLTIKNFQKPKMTILTLLK